VKSITGGANKHLIRIGDRTLAEHALDFMTRSGIFEVAVVSSPGDRPELEKVLTLRKDERVELRWSLQHEPLGTAHAVACAAPQLGTSDTIVLFGDNLFELPQIRIDEPLQRGVNARIFISESSHPENFGVITLAPDGEITAIDCKPAMPPARTVCTGLMCFTSEALCLIPTLAPNTSGELDLMSLVCEVWRRGGLSWRAVHGNWTDVASHAEAVVDAQRTFAH
jgi:glucose-1-phosphate thymidylyltransferase